MGSAWRIIFLTSHICQWFFIVCLVKQYPFVDRALYEKVHDASFPDTFSIAVQIGRFDFATLLLTVLGITLTLAGIFGFVEVRSRSEAAAIAAAKPIAHKVAKETAESEIKPEASRIIEEFFDRKGIDINKLPKREDGIQDNQNIADAMDFDGDENAK